MKKKILITRKLLRSNEERAAEILDVKLNLNDEVYSQKKLIELSKGSDGILSSLTDKIDEKVINSLPSSIKIISNFAVGFGNIDHEAAKKKNWKWSSDFLIGKQLTGSRLGILGMGRIGRAVADRARAFGMKIHYYNRNRLNKDLEKDAIYHKSLESLLSVSDFFSINCPATKETKHIINKETIKYFPDGAVISNSARGDMIDDDAMVNSLKNGKIFSLGLDVYNGEPDIHPEYLNLPNVYVLPHLGSATKKTRTAMADLAVNNIEEFFKNGKCKNAIN